jgi:hypothetical protein
VVRQVFGRRVGLRMAMVEVPHVVGTTLAGCVRTALRGPGWLDEELRRVCILMQIIPICIGWEINFESGAATRPQTHQALRPRRALLAKPTKPALR